MHGRMDRMDELTYRYLHVYDSQVSGSGAQVEAEEAISSADRYEVTLVMTGNSK